MLGIFYIDYAEKVYPRSARKMIIGYTKSDALVKIQERNIPGNWVCWLSECRTPGYLITGDIDTIKQWICDHMPEKFGDPIRP